MSLTRNLTKSVQDQDAAKATRWTSASLHYYRDTERPPPTAGDSGLSEHELRKLRRSDESPNVEKVCVRIRDIQGQQDRFSLGEHGFQISTLHSDVRNWHAEAEIEHILFPEITTILKRETGAKDVLPYEYHIRNATLEDALETDSKGAVDIIGPVRRVHIDESLASARNEFRHHLQTHDIDDERFIDRPFGVYNVWKPLETVRKDPLCLCDQRSVKDEDLQPTRVVVPSLGEIENYSLRRPKEAGAHSWVYVREQRSDQALVFRICDDRIDGLPGEKRSHGVPHTSFVDPGTEHEGPRQSVEVRSFCVF